MFTGAPLFRPVVCLALLLLLATWPAGAGAQEVRVTFRVNDSMVKNKMLAGVKVQVGQEGTQGELADGVTGEKGLFSTTLAPGTYRVSFSKAGYVPLANSPVEVGDKPEQTVTTTLSMMLESAGQGGRQRVQIVINWGSDPAQVKDADSHIQRADLMPPMHVMYKNKVYSKEAYSVELDVDDTDWGGPETITLLDVPAGEYVYWVHNYSDLEGPLGKAGVKVRVLFGDRVAGEFAVPTALTSRHWRPFKALKISEAGEPGLLPFTAAELAAGAHQEGPKEVPPPANPESDDLGKRSPPPPPSPSPSSSSSSPADQEPAPNEESDSSGGESGGGGPGLMEVGVVLLAVFIIILAYIKLREDD